MFTSATATLQTLVHRLEGHSPLGGAARQGLADLYCQVRTHEAGAYVVREGDRPTTCAILTSGFACRQKQTSDGLRQIVSIQIPGDALNLDQLALPVADHSVQMLTRGQVAVMEQADLRRLMADIPQIAHAVFTAVLIQGSISREWVLNIGRRDARSRIAHILCEFGLRMQTVGLAEGDAVEFPMTQEQLADAVGLTPVHVNRTLKALEASGLLLRNKRTITVPCWETLRDVGDFNTRYLHLDGPMGCGR